MRHKDKNTTKPYIFVSLSTQLFVNLEVFTSLKKQRQNVEQRNMPETIYLWFWLQTAHCEPLSFYYTGENCRTLQPLVRNNALHTISDICES